MTSPALYVPLVDVMPMTVGAVVSGTASIMAVGADVPVADAVTPLIVLDPMTIDLTYLPASFEVN
jgi:hypothetical protein